MSKAGLWRAGAFVVLGLISTAALGDSNSRGKFGEGSCAASARIPVPANAAYAIYYDKNGAAVASGPAEVLKGTEKNKMCGAALESGDVTQCNPPKCQKLINGVKYCDVSLCP